MSCSADCPSLGLSFPSLAVEGKTVPSLVLRPTSKSGDDCGGQESGLTSGPVAPSVTRPHRTPHLWRRLRAPPPPTPGQVRAAGRGTHPPVRASSPTSQRRVKEAKGRPFTWASTHIGIRRLARVGHPRPTEGCSRPVPFRQVQWWQSSWGGRWSSEKPALQKVRGSTRHSPSGAQQTPCWGLLGSPRPGSSLRSHSPSTRLQGLGMMKLLFWDWGRAERQGFAPP